MTAHGAKGLEFDDVIILDGGWDERSADEDRDASRRLSYVAMTRARRGLALLRLNGGIPSLNRSPTTKPFQFGSRWSTATNDTEASETHRHPDLSEVYLDFAGRLRAVPIAQGHRRLRTGHPVHLRQDGTAFWLTDEAGTPVGRLAKGDGVPPGG